MNSNYLYSDITGKIIRAFYNVYNKLGFGFLEKVYEKSMMIELKRLGLKAENQKKIQVFYDDVQVGEYYADIVINDCVIVELKAAENIIPEHEAQLVNYLRVTDIEVGLLLNFGKTPQKSRKVLTNNYKIQS